MATPDSKQAGDRPAKPALPVKPDLPACVLRKKPPSSAKKPPIPPKRSSSKSFNRGKKEESENEAMPPDGSVLTKSKVDVNGNHGREKAGCLQRRETQLEQDFFTPSQTPSSKKDHVTGARDGQVTSGENHVGGGRENHVGGGDSRVIGADDHLNVSDGKSPTKMDDRRRPPPVETCAKDMVLTKPVIDVKLVKDNGGKPSRVKDKSSVHQNISNKSAEELLPVVSNLHELHLLTDVRRGMPARSSFFADDAEPPGKTGGDSPDGIYESFGDVQTLLKHSKKEEHTYSLPQPQCYSDSTIKAVKKITEKYDTLQRMKAHALSFRTGTKPRSSPTSPSEPVAAEMAPNLEEAQKSSQKASSSEDLTVDSAAAAAPEVEAQAVETPAAAAPGCSRRVICRLEMFYGSHAAQVVVCRCEADVLCGQKNCEDFDKWQLLATGIPVLVLNTGLGKRPRQLLIVLADKTTGLPVWDDKITYLTNYTEESPGFHTLCLSRNLSKMAGLKMKCPEAADMFLACFREMTSDPHDDLWKVSSGGNRRKVPKGKKGKPLKKADVSHPINFFHITNVNLENEESVKMLFSLADTKEAAGLVQKDRTSLLVS